MGYSSVSQWNHFTLCGKRHIQLEDYTCIHAHAHTHTHTLTLTFTLTHTYTYTLTLILTHTLTHSHTHTYTHSHLHSLTHTYTHPLTHSQVTYNSLTKDVLVGNPHPSDPVTTTLSDLKGDTNYFVTVFAVNGAGRGVSTEQITVRTEVGVFPPDISIVMTNEDNSVYTLRINGFSTDYGALRYMCIYIYSVDIT